MTAIETIEVAKVRFQDSNGGEFDGNAPALDMDYLEATGKYLPR